ncbi:hypothetical protein BU23DRAFT_527657 [Bimuria novae-zelandiae CBS 107.79]|uniref:Prion-inhibition and propagation HeLo domain-containing protein n=1 Tax=Bimuria novae-zelandiae CBS 107.79 TaxID=1447943 RepID=A0A6A5VKV2_9PLEO|nr:hypothetical protein BU23DRAFT_527657 [Bimuria novae-zelandiae CBS 107.79]
MSGFELPGFVVGVVPLVLKSAIEAWKVLDDTISFSEDSEDLIIRLETVKAHLGIWATKAGLTDGELLDSLVPLEELIARTLRRIRDLVTELERQGAKYGLVVFEAQGNDTRSTTATIVQMRRSLRSIIRASRKTNIAARLEAEAASPQHSANPGIPRRVCWAVRDRRMFESFVSMLERHVSGLQNFVIEQDRKRAQQEGTRLALEIIRGLSEQNALSQLTDVSGWDEDFSQMNVGTLAKWKAITVTSTPSPVKSTGDVKDWSLSSISAEDRARSRFIKRGRINPEAAYLFEKKEYDPNIDDISKDQLKDRIQQLWALLSDSKSQRHLHTLQALGYLDDVDHHCWWIIFHFPLGPIDALDDKANQPISLRSLYAAPYKPPLEARYKLAKRLVDTFARLYGSDWMHKGINSRNIIFPHINTPSILGSIRSISAALVQGFNYSRQLTQAQTIDRGKVLNDLEASIYRHPLYQGDAASGYQIHYDIYSLGLVLFEIALWGPLIDMLAAKFRPGKEPPVELKPDMLKFHEIEALELRRRIDIRVEHELAYRVGTKYKDVVQWCLNLKRPVTAIEFYNMVAIPLDDICGQ